MTSCILVSSCRHGWNSIVFFMSVRVWSVQWLDDVCVCVCQNWTLERIAVDLTALSASRVQRVKVMFAVSVVFSLTVFLWILSYLSWAYLLVLSSLFGMVFFVCESCSYLLWAYLIVLSPIVQSCFVNPLATFCRRTSHPSPSSHCTVFFQVPLSDCAYLSKQLQETTCCQFGFWRW